MVEADFETVRERVLAEVTPPPEEREHLREAVEALTERAETALDELPVEAEVFLVGSTARDTWISGERDIDLFVRFPTDLDREELASFGLQVGHEVLPHGREEYAEHPYVTGEFEGFDVDLVPCYDVDAAREIESAVDRTPFHTAYLEERLTDDLADEVRVFKQFLRGIEVYGSNLRTRGFSGYLTELLVLEYGSARAVLSAAADWHPPVELDPEDHGEQSFDDPLVVIDPTDPTRNVAAVLSAENLARLQHHARHVLDEPRVGAFFAERPEPLDAAEVRDLVDDRGTTPAALVFDAPDLVADELYPQLRKSLDGIRSALERRDFQVVRATSFADERAVLLLELAVAERPTVERHEGPPVHVREHAEGFFEKYVDRDVYGPFIDGDRYVVERPREFERAADFLRSDSLFDARLGPAIEGELADGYSLHVGDELGTLAEEFGVELAAYFYPSP